MDMHGSYTGNSINDIKSTRAVQNENFVFLRILCKRVDADSGVDADSRFWQKTEVLVHILTN